MSKVTSVQFLLLVLPVLGIAQYGSGVLLGTVTDPFGSSGAGRECRCTKPGYE